jgi:hypothetical protein
MGGGTTDLMICSYQYEEGQSLAVLKPQPLYWESMTLAGDDLMKEIIQQVMLEGAPGPGEEGCAGVIANAATKMGVKHVVDKMLHFFGTNTNRQGFMTTIYRKNFIVQVAIPIAQRYLQHTIEDLPDTEVGFDQLFPENKPNEELLAWFNAEFQPLRFEEIRWKLSKEKVSSIVETTFDRMFRQLSAILAAYGCDFILLAGRPTTIPRIREMFIKYYPVSPDRIITLNDYRVGRWYPFADEKGFIEDPKTIVAVGALIALMADKLKRLEGFELRTQLLRQMLVSTSDYMGHINPYTQHISPLYLTPGINTCDIDVHTLPLKIGYKQLPNDSYHGRPIYKLTFNEKEIRKRVTELDPMLINENDIAIAADTFRNSLMKNMPFSVRLQRNIRESKEKVTVERVIDANRNERSRNLLALNVMTLPDEYGYWLDTGEFTLNIK